MSSRLSQEIIEEILCRFIVNLPKKELKTDRIFFHVQEAYWFYLDFVLPNKDKAPKLKEKDFGQILLDRSPFRICDSRDYNRLCKEFHDYQSKIPVYGAILLNKTLCKVLLVMNYGQTSYSFPKGKINQNESELNCAAREVWEEIGFPVTKLISEKDYIQIELHGHQTNKMYILTGVDENSDFKTKTRGEIGTISWEKLETIEKSEETYRNTRNPYKNVIPFIKELKTWLRAYKTRPKQEEKKSFSAIINIQMKTSEMIKLPELEKMRSNEKKEDENYNDFKKFINKPSLPRFEFSEEIEKKASLEEKKPDFKKEEKKETPQKKEQKFRILKNTEKNNEAQLRINLFEKRLNEITNNTLKSLSTQNIKIIETNPFRQFKLDTSQLAVFLGLNEL